MWRKDGRKEGRNHRQGSFYMCPFPRYSGDQNHIWLIQNLRIFLTSALFDQKYRNYVSWYPCVRFISNSKSWYYVSTITFMQAIEGGRCIFACLDHINVLIATNQMLFTELKNPFPFLPPTQHIGLFWAKGETFLYYVKRGWKQNKFAKQIH